MKHILTAFISLSLISIGFQEETNVISTKIVDYNCGWNKKLILYVGGLIKLHKPDEIMCSANIVSFRHAITTATCLRALKSNQVGFRLGEYASYETNSGIYEVESLDSYAETNFNDIGIIKTKESMYTIPICLPFRYFDVNLMGESVTILTLVADGLKTTEMTLVHNLNCHEDAFPEFRSCTRNSTTETFRRDSGASVIWYDPATERYYLIGLLSSVTLKHPRQILKIHGYLAWIISKCPDAMFYFE